jgi:hypothetical protein
MTLNINKHNQWTLVEKIKTKAYQLDSISIVAQSGDLDGLNPEITENLFGLMGDLSKEILTLAEQSLSLVSRNA